MDTSVHSVDLFRFLVGEIESVFCRTSRRNKKIEVEDSAVLVLQGKNNSLGIIEASWLPAAGQMLVEVQGTKGTAIYNYQEKVWRYRLEER